MSNKTSSTFLNKLKGDEYKPYYDDIGNLPAIEVYQLEQNPEHKLNKEQENNVLPEANENIKKTLVNLKFVKRYEMDHQKLEYNDGYSGYNFFDIYDSDRQRINIDNQGNVIFIQPDRKIFFINGHDHWNTFSSYYSRYGASQFSDISSLRICHDWVVMKHNNHIFSWFISYKSNRIETMKECKHKAIDRKFETIIPTKVPKVFIFVYKFGDSNTIIVWDLKTDSEVCNFTSREDELYTDYIIGKKSRYGYICFENYIVNMDICVPNPYYRVAKREAHNLSIWGTRINSDESLVLIGDKTYTTLCFKDIYYQKYRPNENLDYEHLVYFINKKSAICNNMDSFENLSTFLSIFEDEPLFYWMIVTQDKDEKTPLDIAIENNSVKMIELMLNMLVKLDCFSFSRVLYRKFPTLFRLNLKSFEKYLNTCYFITTQMKSIDKISLEETNTIRQAYSCCILDKEFYRKYKIGKDEGNQQPKDNQIAPSDKFRSSEDMINIQESEDRSLKRITIKAIEFDWVFDTPEGAELLRELSETKNINIFGQDIIKDIVYFQWNYFQMNIILFLMLPYIIYFVTFCVFSTYIVRNKIFETQESDPFHISAWVIGTVILLFNIGWAYVEIRQIIFYKFAYFKSFWNLLDLSSIILNVAVVIMEFANADFKQVNRVSCISVLLLYFKLFYFLRIFSSTAYLVRMIIEIVIDMKYFVGVLMIATIAFANAFYILGRNSSPDTGNLAGTDFTDAFLFSYRMGIGDFQTSGFNTKDEVILWIIFLINSILVLVVLLNLVIAIMGDTFDRVQETQEFSKLKEITQMIRENEFLFSRKRNFSNSKYIIVIEPEQAEGSGNLSWEGKLNQLKNYIEQSSEDHIDNLRKLQTKIDSIASSALDDKLKPVEDKINSKFVTYDLKLDKIKGRLESLYELISKSKNEQVENK